MKYKFSLLLFSLCMMICFACKDGQSPQETCIDSFLAQSELEPYTGQTWSDCRFFVHLYEYEGGHYFIMDNYCLDMIVTPLDCNGEALCSPEDFVNCGIFEGSVYVGIAGVGDL